MSPVDVNHVFVTKRFNLSNLPSVGFFVRFKSSFQNSHNNPFINRAKPPVETVLGQNCGKLTPLCC